MYLLILVILRRVLLILLLLMLLLYFGFSVVLQLLGAVCGFSCFCWFVMKFAVLVILLIFAGFGVLWWILLFWFAGFGLVVCIGLVFVDLCL